MSALQTRKERRRLTDEAANGQGAASGTEGATGSTGGADGADASVDEETAKVEAATEAAAVEDPSETKPVAVPAVSRAEDKDGKPSSGVAEGEGEGDDDDDDDNDDDDGEATKPAAAPEEEADTEEVFRTPRHHSLCSPR